MTTRRQRYIDELIAAFEAAGVPAAVERSVESAFSYDEGVVLVVHRGRERPTAGIGGTTKRDCELRLSTVTRGNDPEGAADAVLAIAHPILMAFKSEGTFAVTELGTDEPKFAEGKVCVITAHYVIQYKTGPATLGT
jgi:hypothetical protein